MLNESSAKLFDRMRRRLTRQYSGVLTVFLALFVIIVYAVLYLFIWNDQRSQLTELADSEIRILQDWVERDDNPNQLPPRSVEDAFSLSSDQSFYYLIASNGELQLADEIQRELRPQLMGRITDGQFEKRRIEKVTLQTFDDALPIGQARSSDGDNATFLVVDRDLLWNGKRIGKLYVGKEVTFQHNLFRYLLVLLIGIALLFFALAYWLSRYMSSKAIIPVAQAYNRQQEFAADASHELRTPLSVMLTSIEALELETVIESNTFAKSVLNGMKDEVLSITKLTSDLLSLARSDSGDVSLVCAPFDVTETVHGVMEKLRPLAHTNKILIELHVPPKLRIDWDKHKLAQLLMLLMENAIKYTPESGAVSVMLADIVDKGVRSLIIEVKDNGFGIAPVAIPRIFDRFYRQDKARTREIGGHGLGLSIAKHIVEMGHGTIQVDSQEGEGSTFKVLIPLQGK